jgi:hypothetical protein
MLQHVWRRNLRPIRVEIKIEKMRLFEPARFATSDITLLFITDSIFGFLSEIMQAPRVLLAEIKDVRNVFI